MKIKINGEYKEVSFFSFFKVWTLSLLVWALILMVIFFLIGVFLA